jgi:hypothetical protein
VPKCAAVDTDSTQKSHSEVLDFLAGELCKVAGSEPSLQTEAVGHAFNSLAKKLSKLVSPNPNVQLSAVGHAWQRFSRLRVINGQLHTCVEKNKTWQPIRDIRAWMYENLERGAKDEQKSLPLAGRSMLRKLKPGEKKSEPDPSAPPLIPGFRSTDESLQGRSEKGDKPRTLADTLPSHPEAQPRNAELVESLLVEHCRKSPFHKLSGSLVELCKKYNQDPAELAELLSISRKNLKKIVNDDLEDMLYIAENQYGIRRRNA